MDLVAAPSSYAMAGRYLAQLLLQTIHEWRKRRQLLESFLQSASEVSGIPVSGYWQLQHHHTGNVIFSAVAQSRTAGRFGTMTAAT
jgi:hypothetical protein